MKVTRDKNCYCHTCDKYFHYLGITRHRMAHLEKGETVEITYTHGDCWIHRPTKRHLEKLEEKRKPKR